jgi:hypothetical protein
MLSCVQINNCAKFLNFIASRVESRHVSVTYHTFTLSTMTVFLPLEVCWTKLKKEEIRQLLRSHLHPPPHLSSIISALALKLARNAL